MPSTSDASAISTSATSRLPPAHRIAPAIDVREIPDPPRGHQPPVHDELLDVVPERHDAAQVALDAILLEGTGAGAGELRDQPLQDGQLRLVLAQQLHVLGRPGRGDGSDVDSLRGLQPDLRHGRDRDADRIVGAARGRGGQDIGSCLALLREGGGRGTAAAPASPSWRRDNFGMFSLPDAMGCVRVTFRHRLIVASGSGLSGAGSTLSAQGPAGRRSLRRRIPPAPHRYAGRAKAPRRRAAPHRTAGPAAGRSAPDPSRSARARA